MFWLFWQAIGLYLGIAAIGLAALALRVIVQALALGAVTVLRLTGEAFGRLSAAIRRCLPPRPQPGLLP